MCQKGKLDPFIRRHLHGGLSENRLTGAQTGEWNFSAEMRLEKEIASLCATHCCATFCTIYWLVFKVLLLGLLKHRVAYVDVGGDRAKRGWNALLDFEKEII